MENIELKEGFYWIEYLNTVQIALFRWSLVEDLESGRSLFGTWHLIVGDDICHTDEARVLEGPLSPPCEF